jgi:ubiquinone/menaquinone biosynthesis C-methylase UbiE
VPSADAHQHTADRRTAVTEYDRQWVRGYFDRLGMGEWDRLTKSPTDRIKLAVHAHYIREYLQPGWRVLEVGAGAGRFTQIIAEAGCRITVTDVSGVQLDLNRQMAAEHGFDQAVEERHEVDVTDMSVFTDGSYDCVVCYGGPLSYVFERRAQALKECVRVTRSGGPVLVSVMSLWGAAHSALAAVLSMPVGLNQQIIETGDLTAATMPDHGHYCHLFRAAELKQLFGEAGLEILAMSASNCLSTRWDDQLQDDLDQEAWDELVRVEIEASREQGCLDMGTHLIAIGRKECLAD